MRKSILIVGVILLIVGILLIGIVGLGAASNINKIETFTLSKSGEYVSSELILNSPSVVAVRSPASDGGLVPSQDLNLVNSNNLGTYALSYRSSGSGVDAYTAITGDYYYVAFSSSPPTTQVVVANLTSSSLITIGVLGLSGLGLIIAGVIVAIVGVLSKNPAKNPRAVI
jgi:hypothetical protein